MVILAWCELIAVKIFDALIFEIDLIFLFICKSNVYGLQTFDETG